MNFELEYRDYSRRDEDRGEDQYDYSWSESHDYQYYGARIVENSYSDVSLFPGEREPRLGEMIYVVYVSYDSGDSFGYARGCRVHLWAFTDAERASRLCDLIDLDVKTSPDYDYDNKPLDFEGVPIAVNTWKGHFEHFNCVDYESLEVKRTRKNG
jgi:hypothetical protein